MTPTEYLMMEVLAARYRLGERCWTFPATLRKTADRLQERNYVHWKSGVVERTIIVLIDAPGIEAWGLDQPYPRRTGRL